MINTYRTLAAVGLLLLSLTSCKKDDTVVTPPGPVTAIQTAVSVNVNANCGGFYKAVPTRYDSTTEKFPLLIFLHGGSELGNGTTDLAKIQNTPVFSRLTNRTFPARFSSDGKDYSFIVVAPQFKKWPVSADVDAIVEYSIQNLRVETSRIYVMGCSMGGGLAWEYGAAYASKVAAIVPICGASAPDLLRAQKIAAADLPVWAFHNTDDPTVSVNNTHTYVEAVNTQNPTIPALKTIWPTGGHDAWTKASDPSYRENGMNVYEWMLQYER